MLGRSADTRGVKEAVMIGDVVAGVLRAAEEAAGQIQLLDALDVERPR